MRRIAERSGRKPCFDISKCPSIFREIGSLAGKICQECGLLVVKQQKNGLFFHHFLAVSQEEKRLYLPSFDHAVQYVIWMFFLFEGILFAEGPKWQATHNFCKETFRRLGVDTPRFDKVILNETLRLINVWRGQAGGFNPAVYIFPATVNAVSGLLFSRPLEYMGEEFHRLTKREEEGFAVVIGGLVQE